MRKFIVAYMSFFENNLTQEVIFAHTPLEAAIKKLESQGYLYEVEQFCDVEGLSKELFNSDAVISVMEI
jgi:hypothetical protein